MSSPYRRRRSDKPAAFPLYLLNVVLNEYLAINLIALVSLYFHLSKLIRLPYGIMEFLAVLKILVACSWRNIFPIFFATPMFICHDGLRVTISMSPRVLPVTSQFMWKPLPKARLLYRLHKRRTLSIRFAPPIVFRLRC